MVGFVEVGAAVAGLKGLLDIAQGLKAVNDEATISEIKIALQGAVLEAQGGLLAAQAAKTADLQRIGELEQQLVQFEDWERQKERYQLTAIGDVAVAYTLKVGMENGEAPHWACQPCFDTGHKVAFQFAGVGSTDGETAPGP